MYTLTCYDPEHYNNYDDALADGAIECTGSHLDTTATLTGLYDILEVLAMAARKTGRGSVVVGIVERDIFIVLSDIINKIELTVDAVVTVSGAVGILYDELTSITITFTPEEVAELTHRVNMNNTDFARTYAQLGEYKYNQISPADKYSLYKKLNAASNTFPE